jgi:hypothetical protein
MNTRPRDDTVTRPTRFDADTPRLDRFSHDAGPTFTLLRYTRPIATSYTPDTSHAIAR